MMSQASFSSWPIFDEEEIEAVSSVLRSGKVNYWTGLECLKFEKEFAAFHGVKHAVAVANGTVALELALRALEIGPGDEVIVTPRTFIASVSSIVQAGARPVFADVDRVSQNITAESAQRVLTPSSKAILVVHLAGWPCDMDALLSLASEQGLKIIEDCAQAHGASYKNKPIGAMGDVAAFSFCQDKIMTTGGEGGMLLTNDETVWQRAWAYKDHGKNPRKLRPPDGENFSFRWLHDTIGTNWRLTEMQAAIGRVQLRKLSDWIAKRRQNAAVLNECFARIPALRVTLPPAEIGHSYYKYYVFIRSERLRPNWSRDRLIEAINSEGIPCFTGSCPEIYLEKPFVEDIAADHRLPVAKELGETGLMFLVDPSLGETEMLATCRAVEKVFSIATQ